MLLVIAMISGYKGYKLYPASESMNPDGIRSERAVLQILGSSFYR